MRVGEVELFADAVIKSLMSLIRAMEEADVGLVSKYGVSWVDRAIVIANAVREFEIALKKVEPTAEDFDKVLKIANEFRVELDKVSYVMLSKLRRYIIKEARQQGIREFIDYEIYGKEEEGRRVSVYI